jgi:hypothetical protein
MHRTLKDFYVQSKGQSELAGQDEHLEPIKGIEE